MIISIQILSYNLTGMKLIRLYILFNQYLFDNSFPFAIDPLKTDSY
jgi:hypothetical protein